MGCLFLCLCIKAVVLPSDGVRFDILSYFQVICLSTYHMVMRTILPNVMSNFSITESFECTYKFWNRRIRRDRPPGRSADMGCSEIGPPRTSVPTDGWTVDITERNILKNKTDRCLQSVLFSSPAFLRQHLHRLCIIIGKNRKPRDLQCGALYLCCT